LAVSEEIGEFAKDLFSGLGKVSVRPMFGGAGLFCDGSMFGLISRSEVIYLKAEGVTSRAMAAEGSIPFTYGKDDAERSMGYWSLPESSLDDPDEAVIWARRSLELAKASDRK
jgi:DNA transformation protein